MSVPTQEAFAAALARLRTAAGLSRYRLAKLSGVSALHLGRLESGEQRPSLATAQKVAAALGVSMAVFDGQEGQ